MEGEMRTLDEEVRNFSRSHFITMSATWGISGLGIDKAIFDILSRCVSLGELPTKSRGSAVGVGGERLCGLQLHTDS